MLTVIMPVHNQDMKLFTRACYSVLGQTKQCLLHVVDDASAEQNSENYQIFCDAHNIAYSRLSTNVGPGGARQWGIDNGYKMADLISFIDSDDMYLPQFCDIMTAEMQKTGADYLVGNMIHEGNSRVNDSKITWRDGVTWLHGKIYRRSFLEHNNIHFHKNIWFNEDVYFNSKAAHWSDNHGHIDKDLYVWFNNKDSVTRQIHSFAWYQQHNIGYFLSQLYVLEEVLRVHQPVDIGVLIGQLYNAYQTELIVNPESGVAVSMDIMIWNHLHDIPQETWTKYFEKERFPYRVENVLHHWFAPHFFQQNYLDWFEHFKEVIANVSRKNFGVSLYRNNFGKGGIWKRYSGEYDDFPL